MPDDWQPGPSSFVRTGTTWLSYALAANFSYLVNILGPMMPFLRSEMGLSYTMASLHFSAFAGGRVLAGLTSDRLIARLGRQRAAWGGTFGAVLGAAILIMGRHPAVTIAGALIMGIMGASIPVITQAALADQHGPLRAVAFAEVNAAGSGSAVLAPLFVGFFARLSGIGWRGALGLAIFLPLLLFVVFRHQTFPGSARPRLGAKSDEALPKAFWVYWVVLVLVVSVEFCIVYWATDFLEQTKGLARPDAALSTSLFAAGMFFGRLLGSRILRRTQSVGVFFVALGLAAVGFFLHWQLQTVPALVAGLLLAGLGVSILYPLGLTFAMGIAPDLPNKASARATLAVAVAILCLPTILGRVADIAGIWKAYGLVALLLGLTAIIVPIARRVDAATLRRRTPSAVAERSVSQP